MIQAFLWLLSIPVVLAILPLFPFPDIPQAAFEAFNSIFRWIWWFDKYVAVHELFSAATIIVLYELALYVIHLVEKIRASATGSKSLIDHHD